MPWTDAEIRRMTQRELVAKHRMEHMSYVRQERASRPTPGKLEETLKAHAQLAREMVGRGLKHASPLSGTEPGSLAALRADLTVCQLCGGRKVVLPEGSAKAKVVIVGESPGPEEVKQGRPFVGEAGRRLTKVLDSIELAREDVYLTNAVKCYIGRAPRASEVEACRKWLVREVRLVGKGKRIVALGKVAVRALAGEKARAAPHPVARVRGGARRIARALGQGQRSRASVSARRVP